MNSIQEQAEYLLNLWSRLSRQHIALGCSCSMSGISVTLEDFERDIADYLLAESERLGEKMVEEFLNVSGPITEQEKPIRDILSRIEKLDSDDEVEDNGFNLKNKKNRWIPKPWTLDEEEAYV